MRFEPLEARRVLAAVTVTTELDVVDAEDGVTSLREAIATTNAAPGPDAIDFDFGHDGPATIFLTEGELLITDSLTITGDGPDLLTIDAGNGLDGEFNTADGWRIFYITDGVRESFFDVAVSGMTLTGGDTTDLRGGAIHSRENLTVSDSIITGNAVNNDGVRSGGWGGAIQSLYGNLTVRDSIISNNAAPIAGGAIDFNPVFSNNDSSMLLENVDMLGNASNRGGALLLAGPTTIVDSTISGNEGFQGGGVYILGSSRRGEIVIRSTEISGNTARLDGGGVFGGASSVSLSVEQSTIFGNSAARIGGGFYLRNIGAAIPTGTPSFLLLESQVVGNEATSDGGGISLGGARKVEIASSMIADNIVASSNGVGGIYVAARDLEITNATIERNVGYGLQLEGSFDPMQASIIGSTIQENDAGILAEDTLLTVQDTYVRRHSGVGIEILSSDASLSGVEVQDNTAGGLRTNQQFDNHLLVEFSNFSRNGSPDVIGGGISASNTQLTLIQSTLSENSAQSGGGIYLGSGENHLIANTTFDSNIATGLGGGVYVDSQTIQVYESVLTNNEADEGGGIYAGDQLRVSKSTLANNTVIQSGGGIFSRELVLEHSTVADNQARFGGGVYTSQDTQVIASTIHSNTATDRGGGISFSRGEIHQSTISGNRVTAEAGHGGGVAAGGIVELNQTTVANNSTLGANSRGGGLSISSGSILTLRGTALAGNSSAGVAPDLSSSSTLDAEFSLVSDTSGLFPVPLSRLQAGTGNQIDVDALLGPLANNGGPMLTHLPEANSPLADLGDPALTVLLPWVPSLDQRGGPFSRIVNDRIDIGSVEVQPADGTLYGDIDNDGDADGADFLAWQRAYRPNSSNFLNDVTGDRRVDHEDLDVWQATYGTAVSDAPLTELSASVASQTAFEGERLAIVAWWDLSGESLATKLDDCDALLLELIPEQFASSAISSPDTSLDRASTAVTPSDRSRAVPTESEATEWSDELVDAALTSNDLPVSWPT